MRALSIVGNTTVVEALGTEESFDIGSNQVRIVSDRNIHIRVGTGVTDDDFPIRSDQPEIIGGFDGSAVLSIIKGAGETDGKVWITRVSVY